MSIIFEKLKALKNRSSEKDRPSLGLQKEKTTHSIKKLALSPMGGVLIFGTIAGFGLISFYSLSFLKGYLESSSQKAIVVQHKPDGSVPGIPLPGDNLPPTGSEPPVGPDPSTSPDPQAPPQNELKQKPFKVPEAFLTQDRGPYARMDGKTNQFSHLIPAAAAGRTQPDITYRYTPPETPGRTEKDSGGTTNLPSRDNNIPPSGTASPEKSFNREKKEKVQQEKIRKAREIRTQKSSAIAALAADIEEAIEKKDVSRTGQLLNELSLVKDENSPYYLKLKAFTEIQKENYAQAKILLNKVLKKDGTDLDAGINMAVIEIREQAFEDAKKRLMKLKEIYPANSAVDDLLNLL